MAAETKAKKPAGCQIVQLVIRSRAMGIVRRFKDGDGTRTIARDYGLSRAGVEEIIRAFGWLRARQKVHAR